MQALADGRLPRRTLRQLLAAELAPRPGRGAATVRMAVECALAVMVAMIFRIPLPPYLAYIVFLISKDERTATLTSAVGGFLAANLAILLTLVLFVFDLSEPALRLPLMALATFVAMYTSRTFALGPVTFLAGFVLVTMQTVVDDVPSAEALTRLDLWLWVVVLVPVALTVLGEAVAGPSSRDRVRRTLVSVLDQAGSALQRGSMPAALADWRDEVVALLPLARPASDLRRGGEDLTVSEHTVSCVMDLLLLLAVWPDDVPRAISEDLAARMRAARDAIGSERAPVHLSPRGTTLPGTEAGCVVLAVGHALQRLQSALEMKAHGQAPDSAAARAPRRLFVADALTNRVHLRFALKTTLAVMTVYILYTLLDWPGLRTSVVTCFFVALGSLGETVHKLMLRLSGAVIGALLAGLCIVFLLPALTDIGQLCVLIGIVAAGCAWIATSSERLSYAGLQIAFAFFLGVLQDYAPATDLTVLRDRVAGILLGNVVITVVFSTLWPESSVTRMRAAVAGALRGIALMLRSTPATALGCRLETARALGTADRFLLLSQLELQMLPAHPPVAAGRAQVASVTELAGAAVLIAGEELAGAVDPGWMAARTRWLEAAAACLERSEPAPPPPPQSPHSPDTPASLATGLLQQGIQHVASQLA